MDPKEISEADCFITALDWATKQGMHVEFLTFFFRHLKEHKDVNDAIVYSIKEWDL